MLPSDVLNTYRTIIMSGMTSGDYTKATRLVLDMRPIVAGLAR